MRKLRIKRRKSKTFIPLFLIAILSVGYAVITTVLDINGKAHLTYNTWDVHFENLAVKEGSVTATVPARIVDKTGVEFDATLTTPTDYYEFTFDVVNAGTIDAMVGSVTQGILTSEQSEVFEFKITYTNDVEVKANDLLKSGRTQKIKVTLRCKEGVTSSQLENTDTSGIVLDGGIEYVKADETAKTVAPVGGPIMMNIGYEFNDSKLSELKSYYPNLSTVTLNDSINVPEGAPNWDISEAENGTVMAYVVPNTETSTVDKTMYDLHIEGKGGISAPINSTNLFRLASGKSSYTDIIGLDLLDTSKVANMSNMFRNVNKLTNIDVSCFNTKNVTDMSYMFYNCSKLENLDVSNFDTSNVVNMSWMLYSCIRLRSIDVSNFDTNNLENMRGLFCYCISLSSIDLSSWNTSNTTDMSSLFSSCSNLTSININNLNTTKVKTINGMFESCSILTSVNLSSFNTSNTTDMRSLFKDCKKIQILDVSNFITSKVQDMSQMFENCNSLTSIVLSNFSTGEVTTMYYMFAGCSSLSSLDLSNFSTSKVTNMCGMFNECSNLTNLNISSFDTSNVTTMSSMFYYCSSLENLDLSSFDTSKVTDMSAMFNGCSALKNLDIRSVTFNSVKSYSYMFANAASNINIIVKDNNAKGWLGSYQSSISLKSPVIKIVAEL